MRIRNVANKFLYPHRMPAVIVDIHEDNELMKTFLEVAKKRDFFIYSLEESKILKKYNPETPYDGCIINNRYRYRNANKISEFLNIPIFLLQKDELPDKKEHGYLMNKQQHFDASFFLSEKTAKSWYSVPTEIVNFYDSDELNRIIDIVKQQKYSR
jgi:hypothetical protein